MNFEDIVKRESNSDILNKEKSRLLLKFDMLKDSFYSESKINDLNNKMKQKLFDEFRNFFKSQGFSIKSSRESDSYLGELKTLTATIGSYKIEMSISINYSILIKIQHKNDFGTEKYNLSMDICADCKFDSCMKNNVSYDLPTFIELLKKDTSLIEKAIEENKPFEIACKFDDGQTMDICKEYKSFEEIIIDIPEK